MSKLLQGSPKNSVGVNLRNYTHIRIPSILHTHIKAMGPSPVAQTVRNLQ